MSRIKGIRAGRRRVAAMPTVLAVLAREGIAETVNEVRGKGRENIRAMVRRRSGKMLRFYNSSVSRGAIITGRVGYITDRARDQAFYARFIHDGTRHIAARPFHDMAVEETEIGHRQRMRQAQRRTLGGRRS